MCVCRDTADNPLLECTPSNSALGSRDVCHGRCILYSSLSRPVCRPPSQLAICRPKLFVDLSAQGTNEFDGNAFLADMGMALTTDLCIFGTSGDDSIAGGDGDDIIYGLGGSDTLLGGLGSVRRDADAWLVYRGSSTVTLGVTGHHPGWQRHGYDTWR